MKVVTFGELMLKLEPEGFYRFVQAERMISGFGGAEANVAVSLANFGVESVYVTKLPSHEIGQAALNSLRRYGVNTEYIARGGERLGIYYNEKGASQRPSKCIYDRKGSSFAESFPEDYDFKKIFKDADWFHFTGITLALGKNLVDICKKACEEAKKTGCKISMDLNYRSKLWSPEEAKSVCEQLISYADVCICNEEDAAKVFDIKAKNTDVEKGIVSASSYKSVAREIVKKYGVKNVAITLRSSKNASENIWSAILYDGKKFYESTSYDIMIVDRVGGGDSFAAGLIYAMLNNEDLNYAVEFATAAAVLKHTINGDYNAVSAQEVHFLASGNSSGRILR